MSILNIVCMNFFTNRFIGKFCYFMGLLHYFFFPLDYAMSMGHKKPHYL
jgi:hypothetical protein